MSYNDIAAMAHDASLRARLIAAAAQEQDSNPGHWVDSNIWNLVAAPGWADAYGYALASNHEKPGYDEAVISDAMILSAVQARVAALTA